MTLSSKLRSEGEITRVIHVAGASRSGSTLLGMFIGQQDDVCYVGELENIWSRGLRENRMCGCGKPFQQCEFWMDVFERAFGGLGQVDPADMERMRRNRIRKTSWLLQTDGLIGGGTGQYDPYVKAMEALIHAVRATSGANVIVDSSGSTSQTSVLLQGRSLQVEILHHVRDPRGVAYSLLRHKTYEPMGDGKIYWMIGRGPVRAALHWNLSNYGVERISRVRRAPYARVRYEDWLANPRDELSAWVIPGTHSKGSLEAHRLMYPMNHSVSGNPVRFADGPLDLQLDVAWVSAMRFSHKLLVSMLTLPGLRRYRYTFWPSPSRTGSEMDSSDPTPSP